MTTIACSRSDKYSVVACDKQNTLMAENYAFKFNGMSKKIFHPMKNEKIIIGMSGRAMGASMFKNEPRLMKMFSKLADTVYDVHAEGKMDRDSIGELACSIIQKDILPAYRMSIAAIKELQGVQAAPTIVRREIEDDGNEEGQRQLVIQQEVFSSINIVIVIGVYFFTINSMFDVSVYDENNVALGSGQEIALGALCAFEKIPSTNIEKNVETSIQIAAKFDPYTGNEISILKTKKMK